MEHTNSVTTQNSVDVGLGFYKDIAGLFQFGEYGPHLTDAITFVFSQTLQRDNFYGAWAQAYRNGNGEYRVKITSPNNDVSAYSTLIPQYVAAGKLAYSSYYQNIAKKDRKGWEFLLPFGLAMANVKSVQLLHFPPLETFTYKDYLYSPTNRRWECLLQQNGFNGTDNTSVERIIDVAPIAAPGGAGNELTNYNQDFIPYVKAQLTNFLKPLATTKNEFTQPIVAYGGPVHDWLKQAFNLTDTPRTLDILKLSILPKDQDGNAAYSWVLCANHPSEYLYDTDIPLKDATKPNGEYPAPIEVMCQDLIAAGWQAHMAQYPDDDPYKTLADMQERWGWDTRTHKVKPDKVDTLLAIMKEQNTEFNLNNDTFTPSEAQLNATRFTLVQNPTSQTYCSFATDTSSSEIFTPIAMSNDATLAANRRLMQAGGYMIDWLPAASDDDTISYRVVSYDRNSSDPMAEKAIAYGRWKKDKFFNNYRPNYGADFSQLELYGFPGYVLSIIPAAGRRSYQLWNFDPLAEDDILSAGEFTTGGFRDIDSDSELFPIGNYVLERKANQYKVWSFDPQSSPPLALPTLQAGVWQNIDESDAMAVLGDQIITWKPCSLNDDCRIWQFDAHLANPLGEQPIATAPLPNAVNAQSILTGIVPQSPVSSEHSPAPGSMAFMQQKIEHVVYYMLESRSFDNVLGWLYQKGQQEGINWIGPQSDGFRGLSTSLSNPMPDGSPAYVSQYQNGQLSNDFVLGGPAQDPWHDNSDVLMQMYKGYAGYANRQQPSMNGFAWNQNSAAVLSSFTPTQLPVLNGIAKHFGISDDWFSSVPGGTDVNRGYSVSGSCYNRLGTWEGGTAYQNWPDEPHRQSFWKTLWNHGHQDWKIYYTILWKKAVFTYQLYLKGQIPEVDAAWAKAVLASDDGSLPNSQWISPLQQFFDDVKSDNLPKFSYLEPAWVGDNCTSYHPGSSATGINSLVPAEKALNDIYQALTQNKSVWEKTLLVITFDKNGGLYDHIPPSYANKAWPNDLVDGFAFDVFGPRVPAVFASPWIKPNTVLRESSGKGFDATAFGATLLDWYGIDRSTWGLGDRMGTSPTFETIFNESEARKTSPQMTLPYDKDYPTS